MSKKKSKKSNISSIQVSSPNNISITASNSSPNLNYPYIYIDPNQQGTTTGSIINYPGYSGSSPNINTGVGSWTITSPFKCTSCKKESTSRCTQYSGSKITRYICQKCYCKKMDKLFGIKINSELEDTLYEK